MLLERSLGTAEDRLSCNMVDCKRITDPDIGGPLYLLRYALHLVLACHQSGDRIDTAKADHASSAFKSPDVVVKGLKKFLEHSC